jgi:hypothetical protein
MNLTTGIVACPSATGHGAAAPTGLETAGFNSILISALPEELNLEISREVTDGVAMYRIVGRIDASTSLESAIDSDIRGSPRIIFDMGEVTFILQLVLGSF